MPPVAPPSRSTHPNLIRLLLIVGAAAAVIVLVALYKSGILGFSHHASVIPTDSNQIEFVAASSAAVFNVSGATLTPTSNKVDTLGPVKVPEGATFTATLVMPPPPPVEAGKPPPPIIAPPQPAWTLKADAAMLGAGRPLGVMADGSALVLTDKGLVAYIQGGHVPVVRGASNLVGAVTTDGTIAALRNAATRATDIYTITPKSFYATYIASIPGDPLAIAFGPAAELYVIKDAGAVSQFALSSTSVPTLVATTTLATPWP